MASMREAAKKNLEKMVKGAAREVTTARDNRSGASAEPQPGAGSPSKGLTKAVYQQLMEQITKHGKTIQKVPIESIRLHENIRESYHEESLKILATSMEREGLIQFPTLCLKDEGSEPAFVCKNGHRRILAAKMLGWKTIECIILPFASARDELYHTIAANLREDVFYLDIAAAYQQASRLGETDQAIAERVGVNQRTVGWYRRLTRMSPECQALARQHAELFSATWAIKLARQGELPPPAQLLKLMEALLARQQALQNRPLEGATAEDAAAQTSREQKQVAREQLKSLFGGDQGAGQAQFAWGLLEQLTHAGYLSPKQLERMKRQLQPGARKGTRKAATTATGA
jgi:ParB-like chromosome segregation protein Spo0J